MTAARSIKVFSELRDLEIFDSRDELCGVADDIEFGGAPLRVRAILVGPAAFAGRLPALFRPLVRWTAGGGVTRVPWAAVEHVTSRITLNRTAESLGLAEADRRLARLLKKLPFA